MSEIASIHTQVETCVLNLGARAQRIYDALRALRHETVLRFRLDGKEPAAIERWLAVDEFEVDRDGFFQSRRRRDAHRRGAASPAALTQFWPAAVQHDPLVRARMFALRDIGERLVELQREHPGVTWIYYQDLSNAAVLFPYLDIAAVLPPTFDWRGYHTFASLNDDAQRGREIRWTPPTVDYGGAGLITSASIPVIVDDELVGLWSIDVPLETLHSNQVRQRVVPEQGSFIVDLEGWLVDHDSIRAAVETERGSVVRRAIGELGRELSELDLRALAREGAGTFELTDDEGERLVMVFRLVPELDWLVFGTFPKSKMLAAINDKVMEAFRRIGRGELSYRITSSVSDDMRQLVNAYNEMSAALQADLAARQRYEAELRAAKIAAEEASAAKDRFLAQLSHELRTPLSPVLAAVSFLQANSTYAAELGPTLEMIRRNVEIEVHLIDDLLDVNAITRGKSRLVKRVVDAYEVIERACETCRAELEARRIVLACARDATAHLVDADPDRLQQALWNLLRNAAKFSEPGGRILVRAHNPAPGRLRVEVSDTGVGLAPEDHERIFDAFEQVTSDGRGGLGIGLTIAKAIMEAHGGTIDVHSAGRGRGATFGLELAIRDAPVEPRRHPRGVPPEIHPLRLLLVEDNADMAEVLVLALESRGHTVMLALTGQEAIERVRSDELDLVISDLGLPDMTGYELVRRIRELPDPPPAIAVSGYGGPEDLQRSADAGFLRHLTKPIEIRQLDAVISELMDHGRPPRQPVAPPVPEPVPDAS